MEEVQPIDYKVLIFTKCNHRLLNRIRTKSRTYRKTIQTPLLLRTYFARRDYQVYCNWPVDILKIKNFWDFNGVNSILKVKKTGLYILADFSSWTGQDLDNNQVRYIIVARDKNRGIAPAFNVVTNDGNNRDVFQKILDESESTEIASKAGTPNNFANLMGDLI
jgi:hypothetical protein